MTGTKKKVIFGDEESVLGIFEEHTAYVERTHLTMRQTNSRLVRKELGFSKELANQPNRPAERPAWTTMEKANACHDCWAHRSGVVNRETAPNRADCQRIIGPLPGLKSARKFNITNAHSGIKSRPSQGKN